MDSSKIKQRKMKKSGEVVSMIVMAIGLIQGVHMTQMSISAPQYVQALVPIIGAYVLGRAIENITK